MWFFLSVWFPSVPDILLLYEPGHSVSYNSTYVHSEDSIKPASLFTRHSVGSQGFKAVSGGQRRLWSACADAQTGLWRTYMRLCRKCCARVIYVISPHPPPPPPAPPPHNVGPIVKSSLLGVFSELCCFQCAYFTGLWFDLTKYYNPNPAGTWLLYNVGSTSMQSHDVASTLRRRCINVMCLLGILTFHLTFLNILDPTTCFPVFIV